MDEARPLLELTGATVRFGADAAIDGVDFRMFPGEVHSLMGENGAGKSTLIKAITGALPLSEGELRIAGEPVRFANCSPVPCGSSNGSRFSASPINARPTSESARVDRNSWYASAAAWVLTSSARERTPMARTSASDRDCARVAILGSMARGAS